MIANPYCTLEALEAPPLDATIDRFRTLMADRFAGCMRVMKQSFARLEMARRKTTGRIRQVCDIAGSATLVDDARVSLAAAGVLAAIKAHDDRVLFEWLVDLMSYQGVSDSIAQGYMELHGRITSADVEHGLVRTPACPKLNSYWQFHGCGYRKTERICAEPELLSGCPLPRHALRNGRLNRTAYSLFLFCRDVAGRDLVHWLDERLAAADQGAARTRGERLAAAVVQPMTEICGVSDKILNMTLSALLLAGDPERERWQTAGAAMIAIDTLVHNWLHRTGALKRLGASHVYGAQCYGPNGCAAILRSAATHIDARRFNPGYPRNFPRFVQHAVWRFCSQTGLDQCNGNRVNDKSRCDLKNCALYSQCDRVTLHRPSPVTPPV